MGQLKKGTKESVTHLFIYALTFLVLWEWLRPVPVVTATADIHIFVWFAFVSAVVIYLRIPFWVNIPLLLGISVYGLHILFHEGPFFSREGGWDSIKMFAAEIRYNTGLIFGGDFAMLTDPFRTFLLFMLLALVCYLLYFWIFETRRIFFFLLMTVIYITLLDTFTAVDASAAIVRIIIIGFFMLTLLHMLKVQEEEREIGRRTSSFFSPAWMYTLIFMILAATAVGMAAPKPEPQWSDPVPAMRGLVWGDGGGSGQGVRRVGYGENDERLGGGFIQDESPVFTAEVSEAVYWRGESKDYYTGQGWTSDPQYEDANALEEYELFTDEAQPEEKQAQVTFAETAEFSLFFYPGQLSGIYSLEFLGDGEQGDHGLLDFFADTESGKFMTDSNHYDSIAFTEYEVIYDSPTFPVEALRNSGEDDPEEIRDRYLQLPEDLPARVSELAEEIAEDEDNRYDIASAVEQYFSREGFVYQTTDVSVPEDGQDYVDEFLFETQAGYCDNYSTSMTVMLRTLGIPARWVKGFTSGEQIEELDDDRYLYEVTNGNAHSWVEVYFPEVGWVPFEPTQGFDNYAEFEEAETDIDIDIEDEDREPEDMPEHEREDFLPELDEGLDEGDDTEATGTGIGSGRGFGEVISPIFTPKGIIISIVVLVMVMVAYEKKHKIQNQYFLMHYRLLGRDEKFPTAYRRLLWILENEGLPKTDGETLREYARRVDMALSSQAMMKLTKMYEKVFYGGAEPDGDWDKLKKDWEEIVRALNY